MKNKSKKMDKKLVARLDPSEINYIAKTYKIPVKDVRKAAKDAGRSRKKVYAKLREMGYTIKTRFFK